METYTRIAIDLILWTQDLPLTQQHDALSQVKYDGQMPCVKRHYTNPKNLFTPKPLNQTKLGRWRVMA